MFRRYLLAAAKALAVALAAYLFVPRVRRLSSAVFERAIQLYAQRVFDSLGDVQAQAQTQTDQHQTKIQGLDVAPGSFAATGGLLGNRRDISGGGIVDFTGGVSIEDRARLEENLGEAGRILADNLDELDETLRGVHDE